MCRCSGGQNGWWITPEGQSFLSDTQSMVAIAAQAKLRFHNPDERPIEKLAIGCGSYHLLVLLSQSLKELGTLYPNLHPHLVKPHRNRSLPTRWRLLRWSRNEDPLGFCPPQAPTGVLQPLGSNCPLPENSLPEAKRQIDSPMRMPSFFLEQKVV